MTALSPVDEHLDRVTAVQTMFKNPILANVGSAICAQAIACGGNLWPDEVPIKLEKEHSKCIGIAYRILGQTLKCIQQVEPCEKRRSRAEGRRGGVVFKYAITDWKLCSQIARLEWEPQMEMGI